MHDYFRGRRPWRQLDRLLPRFPRHSHYRAAIDSDPDIAELASRLPVEDAEPAVALAGYSEIALRLDNVFDAVCAVNETLQAVYSSAKRAKPRPVRAPRPRTAYQELRTQRRKTELDSIVDRMTGGR